MENSTVSPKTDAQLLVDEKFAECIADTNAIFDILNRVTIVKDYESFETDEIIPSWYACHKWHVKIKGKKVYLVIFQSANNLMKIEAYKGNMVNFEENKMVYFDLTKFIVNDFPDYMRADKLEDRLNTLQSIL
jgi:hypothetical protein